MKILSSEVASTQALTDVKTELECVHSSHKRHSLGLKILAAVSALQTVAIVILFLI